MDHSISPTPKVSVHMPAYNHENYIAQALDSVLMQKVDFDYEIVVGEDCSTDRTRDVARAYARNHPATIRVLEHDKNLGIWANDQAIIGACRGEYIAWLESDDYWTAPTKLQRQVDYLEQHPDASACFHRAGCLTDTAAPITWRGGPETVKPEYTVDDLLEQGHFMPSCTVVFRTNLVRPALEWTGGTPFLETSYAMRFALAGKIGFIDEEMAMYRYHGAGVYGQARELGGLQHAVRAHELVGRGFGLLGRASYRAGLARRYAALGNYLMTQGAMPSALVAKAKSFWLSL